MPPNAFEIKEAYSLEALLDKQSANQSASTQHSRNEASAAMTAFDLVITLSDLENLFSSADPYYEYFH